jgi:hypothetical protein
MSSLSENYSPKSNNHKKFGFLRLIEFFTFFVLLSFLAYAFRDKLSNELGHLVSWWTESFAYDNTLWMYGFLIGFIVLTFTLIHYQKSFWLIALSAFFIVFFAMTCIVVASNFLRVQGNIKFNEDKGLTDYPSIFDDYRKKNPDMPAVDLADKINNDDRFFNSKITFISESPLIWRETYTLTQPDCQKALTSDILKGFDVLSINKQMVKDKVDPCTDYLFNTLVVIKK